VNLSPNDPHPLETLGQKYQDYWLHVLPKKREVSLGAHSRLGVLYAAATLVQLIQREAGGLLSLPEVTIHDWPDFEFRAADWLLKAETSMWAYDFGQGKRRYVERVLARHGGNVTAAARASGVAHRYFQLVRARVR
jgi:hypothetical protein